MEAVGAQLAARGLWVAGESLVGAKIAAFGLGKRSWYGSRLRKPSSMGWKPMSQVGRSKAMTSLVWSIRDWQGRRARNLYSASHFQRHRRTCGAFPI